MADTHLQINPDGSTEMRKTVLWPSSTAGREEVLKSIFSQNNWDVTRLYNVSGSHWKVEVSCQQVSYKINLYISSVRDEARQDDEFKMQLGNSYPTEDEDGWITLILGIYAIADDEENIVDYILSAYNSKNFDFSSNPSIRGTRTSGLQMARILGFYKTDKSYLFRPEFLYYYIQNQGVLNGKNLPKAAIERTTDYTADSVYSSLLTALRTKPFLLLAGISGTGKSRIVRELAFKSCPEFLRDADGTTPGNYCMIEVKPNWHDSSELLGYYSHISKEYQYTNFIKFLVKAMMFPDVPFFVCLDEMNLAPVEQYFAEFLSVLETRKKVGDRIHTGALVKPEYFAELQNAEGGDGYIFTQWFPEIKRNIPYNIYTNPTLAQVGLTLPDNVFIIGTVNMDDTTHQFSRKVLDRAMTIEMNGGKLSDMFGQSHNLEYLPEEDIWDVNKFIPEYVTADEVIAVNPDTAEELKTKLPERLEEINEVLKDTPFVVSYRVLNELVIYTGNLLNDGMSIDEAIDEAVNQIVLMKILPRIEGDEDMFIVKGAAENRLEQLAHLVSGATKAKLEEMNNRLSTGFTRFWP